MTLTLPMVFVMIVAIILIAKSIIVVPRGKVIVISTFGRPTRVLNTGLNVVPPIVTGIAGTVPVDEQTLDVPETAGRLQDGTPVPVKGSIRYRVSNPLVAVTSVHDYRAALAEVAQTHWRRALETSDVVRFRAALEAALPAIRTAAATWGIDAMDATALATPSEDGLRQLEQRVALERETRVLDWLEKRAELPGPDSRPTTAQQAAYNVWIEQGKIEHREEIEAAAGAARVPAQHQHAGQPIAPLADAEAGPFQGAAPTALTFAVARSAIPPRGTGLVEANGREWPAQNQSTVAILAGFRCVVERQEGDTLIVRPM